MPATPGTSNSRIQKLEDGKLLSQKNKKVGSQALLFSRFFVEKLYVGTIHFYLTDVNTYVIVPVILISRWVRA